MCFKKKKNKSRSCYITCVNVKFCEWWGCAAGKDDRKDRSPRETLRQWRKCLFWAWRGFCLFVSQVHVTETVKGSFFFFLRIIIILVVIALEISFTRNVTSLTFDHLNLEKWRKPLSDYTNNRMCVCILTCWKYIFTILAIGNMVPQSTRAVRNK